jgi:hypothetical protein
MAIQHALAPRLSTRLAGRLGHRGMTGDEHAPATAGSLFEPMDRGTGAHGGWGTDHGREAWGLRLLALGAAAVPLGLYAWQRRNGRAAA